MRSVPPVATSFVAAEEGLRLVAYPDLGDVWTIGYGHTGPDVHVGLKVTQAQARKLLAADLQTAASRLQSMVKREVIDELTENQYAALLSFTFNLGVNKKWTIWKTLNARQFDQIPAQMMRFVYVGKTKVRGLVNRRAKEVILWSTDEPGSVDEFPASGATRREDTPPAHGNPQPLVQNKAFMTTAATGVTAAAAGVAEVSEAINPFAWQSDFVQRIAGLLAILAAALAVAGVVFMWLKKREEAR